MKAFTDKYGKTLKSIKITFYDLSTDDLKSCLIKLSLFENLQSLDLSIYSFNVKHNAIDECLQQMTRNLNKLKNLKLNFFGNNSLIGDHFFSSLSQLKQNESLKLVMEFDKELRPGIKFLIECPKLKKLVINYTELTESFFKDIHSSIPRIEFLTIDTNQRLSDEFFTSLSSMKYLQRVSYCYGREKTHFYYNQSIKNCKHNAIIINTNCWKKVFALY